MVMDDSAGVVSCRQDSCGACTTLAAPDEGAWLSYVRQAYQRFDLDDGSSQSFSNDRRTKQTACKAPSSRLSRYISVAKWSEG